MLFLNQRKRENGRRNVFMTKSPRKTVPDVGIELGAACMSSERASDRATAPGTVASSSNLGMLMSLIGASLVLEITKSTLRMFPHFWY